jgi:hypothetical protein
MLKVLKRRYSAINRHNRSLSLADCTATSHFDISMMRTMQSLIYADDEWGSCAQAGEDPCAVTGFGQRGKVDGEKRRAAGALAHANEQCRQLYREKEAEQAEACVCSEGTLGV